MFRKPPQAPIYRKSNFSPTRTFNTRLSFPPLRQCSRFAIDAEKELATDTPPRSGTVIYRDERVGQCYPNDNFSFLLASLWTQLAWLQRITAIGGQMSGSSMSYLNLQSWGFPAVKQQMKVVIITELTLLSFSLQALGKVCADINTYHR